MFDIITKSKIRRSILSLLFAHENKAFYLSEIAGLVGTSRGTAQRELNRLVRAGFVYTEKKTNIREFGVNKKNPLFREIKAIIHNTVGVEAELKKMIAGKKEIKFAFIFGSYAKGTLSEESDIDLCLIGQPEENDLIRRITKLEYIIRRDINYHIYTDKEFRQKIKDSSFVKNIIKKYILLTDNQNEFKRLFQTKD
ncbi:MAG: nucleotidyltransferase domain-containing protein [Candidatus Falkowbacteria bacterium]